jgi:pimeloyl-ACP methyl ester carboxylesterase
MNCEDEQLHLATVGSESNASTPSTLTASLLESEVGTSSWDQTGECCCSLLWYIAVAPFYILGFLAFVIFFAVSTATGLGPAVNYFLTSRDEALLNRDSLLKKHPEMRLLTIPGGVNSASDGKPYSVMTFTMRADNGSSGMPVIIPGGLGASLFFLVRVQEYLKRAGISSISFDRLGVGCSDPNPSGRSPSAVDVCREMDFVMSSYRDVGNDGSGYTGRWISIGGSMGSTVVQAYMSLYPCKIAGFLNLDGFPYPYEKSCAKSFITGAASQWKTMESLVWTGLPRLLAAFNPAVREAVEGSTIPSSYLNAQLCARQFFANTVLEYRTMFSCCELANAAWGTHSIHKLSDEAFAVLVRTAPDMSVLVNEYKFHRGREAVVQRREVSARSSVEAGGVDDAWASCDQTELLRDQLLAMPYTLSAEIDLDTIFNDIGQFAVGSRAGGIGDSVDGNNMVVHPLFPQWRSLVVRVMSCRHYSSLARKYVSQQSLNYSAAEHNMHVLLARDGYRTVYPQLAHTEGFAQTLEIVNCVTDINQVLRSSV